MDMSFGVGPYQSSIHWLILLFYLINYYYYLCHPYFDRPNRIINVSS
jgi:cytochrome b561